MATRKKKTSIKTKAKKTVKKEKVLGMVTHYFEKIDVAVIKLSQSLKVGDYIEFRHGDVSFSQIVESMQVNHKNIPAARIGSEIGLKVAQKVKEGFKVYKVEQPKLELEPTKPKVEVNKYSYKPIFPTKRNMDDYRPTLISRPTCT